ncbi:MAG: DegV family protein [Acidimicrobiia bacterium]|nr:DegV family protein [Acidimicrobiia bacterium]
MTVRIVTDSSCDLTAEEAAELGVRIVPLSIHFGEKTYTDRVDLSADDFYRTMSLVPELPGTSAPSPGSFEEAFRGAAAEADAVVCITISSELSATMQSAVTAAKTLEGEIDVRVVDSKSITSGLGTIVIHAARAAAEGADAESVCTLVDELSARTRVFGALDTLDNLKKGGRIGGAQALLGSMLSIKPVIDISTGVVEQAAKPRTRRKAIEWLRDKVVADMPVEDLCVTHGNAPDVEQLLEALNEHVPRDQIRVGTIGAVIGAHGGPRVLGVTYLTG